MTKEELSLELKKSVAKANRKLKKLDEQGITSFAEKIARNKIKNFYNDDSKQLFSYNKTTSYNDMEKLLKITENFNASKGSTKTGIKSYIKKREQNFDARGVSNEQLSNMYDLLNSDNYNKLVELYKDSNQVVDAIINANLTNYNEEDFNVESRLEKALEKFKGTSSDEMYLDDLVKELSKKPRKKTEKQKEKYLAKKKLKGG